MAIPKGVCILSLKEAAAKYLDEGEIEAFIVEFDNKVKEIQSKEILLQTYEAEGQAAKELFEERKLNAILQKRQAAKNALIRLQIWEFLQPYQPKDWNTAIKHLLGGTAGKYLRGNASSVARQMDSLASAHIGSVLRELEDNGLDKFWRDKNNQRSIMIELGEMKEGGKPGKSGSKAAQQIAEILARHQELARLEANRCGANIEKLPGYIIAQTHDPEKLWPKKGETMDQAFERWREFIFPLLDAGKTFKGMDGYKVLREMWNSLRTGAHMVYDGDGISIRTAGNKAQQLSNSRKIHFKDGDSFFKYNEMYGKGDLVTGYLEGLIRLTKSTVLMQRLGTNPVDTINKIYNAMEVSTVYSKDPNVSRTFISGTSVDSHWDEGVENLFKEITGRTNVPVNNVAAKLMANIRTWILTCRLGMSAISSFSDIATSINNAMYMGMSQNYTLMQTIKMLGTFSNKQLSAAERHFLADFGIVADTIKSNLYANIANSSYMGSGFFSKLANIYFNLSGQTHWTKSVKSAAALSVNHALGEWLAGSFDKILPRMQKRLNAYNIGESEFKLLKKMPLVESNGERYLSPENVHKIPDEDFAAYLGINEQTPGYKNKIYAAKKDLENNLVTFVFDMANTSAIEPGAIERAWLHQGTQVGSVKGEIFRSLGQFKSFPISIITKIVNPWLQNASTKTEGLMGFMHLFMLTTVLGYLSVTCKDLLRGKKPQEFGKESLGRAMLQGGALGLFGDIMFGEAYNSLSLGSTLGGPLLSTADDLYAIYIAAREGNDAKAETIRRARNFMPGQNLFWAKLPLDYLLMNGIQEWANPGYLDRLQRNLYNKTGQEYWLDPGTFVK